MSFPHSYLCQICIAKRTSFLQKSFQEPFLYPALPLLQVLFLLMCLLSVAVQVPDGLMVVKYFESELNFNASSTVNDFALNGRSVFGIPFKG